MAGRDGAVAMTPHVLVVAGTDSSGGAGLSRDIETIATLGLRTSVAVTAVTVQTHDAVHRVEHIAPDLIAAQMRAAFAANPVAAVKIGMLGTTAAVEAVASVLASSLPVPVVLDPVLASTSGRRLLDERGRRHAEAPVDPAWQPHHPEPARTCIAQRLAAGARRSRDHPSGTGAARRRRHRCAGQGRPCDRRQLDRSAAAAGPGADALRGATYCSHDARHRLHAGERHLGPSGAWRNAGNKHSPRPSASSSTSSKPRSRQGRSARLQPMARTQPRRAACHFK